MTEPTLDRSGATPLHAQIAGTLQAAIRDRQLQPGMPLPSEAALQERYGVSRSVIRQALAALAADGLIDRVKGRGSTVASPKRYHRLVQRSSGLSTQLATTGARSETTVLSIRDDTALPVFGAATTGSLRLERLRCVDGIPIAVIHTSLPLPACASLSAVELENTSLHEVLLGRFGLRVIGGNRQVRAVAADENLAGLLGTAIGEPLLLLEGQSLDQHGRVIEIFSTWHRGDLIAFDIEGIDSEPRAAQRTADPPDPLQRAAELAKELSDQLDALATPR